MAASAPWVAPKVRSFSTTKEAQAHVRACLRKRATAPRRIGVAYRVRRMDGCANLVAARSSLIRMARGLPRRATSLGWVTCNNVSPIKIKDVGMFCIFSYDFP